MKLASESKETKMAYVDGFVVPSSRNGNLWAPAHLGSGQAAGPLPH
jgi:hypothetical protein